MAYKNIPFGEVEAFNVLIEIPEGSYNKYEYDEEFDEIKLNFVFWGDCKFPHNYGLVFGTHAGDGDHLDCIVLNPVPLAIGTVVKCRAIGIIETVDRGETDNKLIAVPVCCEAYGNVKSAEDLPDNFGKIYKDFYKLVGIQKNKVIEVGGVFGKEKAVEELNKTKIKNLWKSRAKEK